MSDLPLSITHGSSLGVIAAEVSRASKLTPLHYVERRADLYRWSPAHRGGPYPLLRTVAKVMGVDYRELMVPCAPLPESNAGFGPDGIWAGLCIVPAEPALGAPDSWTVLELSQAVSSESVERQLRERLNH